MTDTEKTEDQVQDVQNTAPAQEAVDNDLTINDLNAMKQIIDIASSRGSFKANELEAVGKIYNKLSNFLSQATTKGQQNG